MVERDPQRIEPLLDALRDAWRASPDQRLGQLIYNAARTFLHENTEVRVPPCPPLFYIEDEPMLEGLRRIQSGRT